MMGCTTEQFVCTTQIFVHVQCTVQDYKHFDKCLIFNVELVNTHNRMYTEIEKILVQLKSKYSRLVDEWWKMIFRHTNSNAICTQLFA